MAIAMLPQVRTQTPRISIMSAVSSHLRSIAQGKAAIDFEALQLETGGE